MHTLLILTSGGLYVAGFFLMLRRSVVKLVIGLVMLGHATNLLVFSAGRLVRAQAPFVPEGGAAAGLVSDPLPQALILTAIVIGFGVQAFAIVLIRSAYQVAGAGDLEQMRATDQAGE